MPEITPVFVGLDVHKDTISVAYAAGGESAPPHFVGQVGTRPCDIDKLVRRLQARSPHLVFAYEADPCGYVLSGIWPGKASTAGSWLRPCPQEARRSGEDRPPRCRRARAAAPIRGFHGGVRPVRGGRGHP